MLNDALVSFGSGISVVGGSGAGFASSVIDLLGLGVGVAPVNIIGNRTKFGMDPGIGWPRAQAGIIATTALATASGATMNFKYQGSEDDATTHQPTLWRTIVESGELAVTDLDEIATLNAFLWQFDFEPTHPLNFMPRYLRVLAQVSAAASFTTGIISIPVTLGLDQPKQLFTPRNYVVGAP